ncbi:MAG: hypothetical protein QM775_26140 [Pirellulales bacterium]
MTSVPLRRTAWALALVLATAEASRSSAASPTGEPAATPGASAPMLPSATGSQRTTLPWTVPPPNSSSPPLSFPNPAAMPSSTTPDKQPEPKQPNVDYDEIREEEQRSVRFTGRNGAVLDGPRKGVRQREGTKLVERRGRFEVHGDRVVFLAQDPDAHFVVLENLALERVVRSIEESGPQLLWSISGQLTEYRSTNYLIISRATVKSIPGAVPATGKPSDPTAATNPQAPPQAGAVLAPQTLAPPTAVRRLSQPR